MISGRNQVLSGSLTLSQRCLISGRPNFQAVVALRAQIARLRDGIGLLGNRSIAGSVVGISRTRRIVEQSPCNLQVGNQGGALAGPIRFAQHAENACGMIGRDRLPTKLGCDDFPAALLDAKVAADQRLGGRRAKADDHLRLDQQQFGKQPGTAGNRFVNTWFLVKPRLSAWLVLEMLDRVRDVDRAPIDAGLGKGRVEDCSGRADERATGAIFLIARLFTNERDPGIRRTFAKDRLCRMSTKVTSSAAGGGVAQSRPVGARGDEIGGGCRRTFGASDHPCDTLGRIRKHLRNHRGLG